MRSYEVARRAFLRSCAGSAALLVPLLRSIESRAQGLPAPLRFLVIHHSLGTQLDLWRPTAQTTTANFVLPANSAPFEPLRSKMMMIDGLNIVTDSLDGSSGGAFTGEGGMLALMTGVPTLGRIGQQDHAAGGMSIDQLFLDRSPVLGGNLSSSPTKTRFQSLQLAADIRSDRDEVAPRVMSYRPPTASMDLNLARQPMFPETQPLAAFSALFGGPTDHNPAAMLAQDKSVLDFMRSDLSRLQGLVPASERPKLEVHADAIRQLEASLRALISGPATPASMCARPLAPPFFPQLGVGDRYSKLTGVDNYVVSDPTLHPHRALGRAHLAIIKAAFSCDLARVATFSWSPHGTHVVFPGTVGGTTLTLNGAPIPFLAPHLLSDNPDVGVQTWLAAVDRDYAEQTSQAIQEFAGTTDLDGSTLLDNTVIPYVSEVGRAVDHSQMNVPVLVFGGIHTRIRGGTFLKVSDGPLPMQDATFLGAGTGNRPFNDLWMALAPIFGVEGLTTLGSAKQHTSPLAGLLTP